jgi:transcriptional regulator with XRE-family HTH domain
MVDDEVRKMAHLLEALVKLEKVSVRELERRLGFGGGTLNRIFNGRNELKVRHVLLVLEALEIEPAGFFKLAFPDRASHTPHASEDEKGAVWLQAALQSLRPREDPPPAVRKDEVREMVLEVLRELATARPAS